MEGMMLVNWKRKCQMQLLIEVIIYATYPGQNLWLGLRVSNTCHTLTYLTCYSSYGNQDHNNLLCLCLASVQENMDLGDLLLCVHGTKSSCSLQLEDYNFVWHLFWLHQDDCNDQFFLQ